MSANHLNVQKLATCFPRRILHKTFLESHRICLQNVPPLVEMMKERTVCAQGTNGFSWDIVTLSGWYRTASFLYARLMSAAEARSSTPRTLYGFLQRPWPASRHSNSKCSTEMPLMHIKGMQGLYEEGKRFCRRLSAPTSKRWLLTLF